MPPSPPTETFTDEALRYWERQTKKRQRLARQQQPRKQLTQKQRDRSFQSGQGTMILDHTWTGES